MSQPHSARQYAFAFQRSDRISFPRRLRIGWMPIMPVGAIPIPPSRASILLIFPATLDACCLLISRQSGSASIRQSVKEKHGKPPKKTSSRTVNMEISTLRMILKAHKLWSAIQDEVRMLPERKKIGKALTADQARNLLNACHNSPQPSLYTAVVIFCNTALRNAELRRARWHQVDFLRAEFQVGEAKTEESAGRIIPLNATALEAFKA